MAKEDYTIGCASEIVRTVFNAVPELRYLFVCLRNDAQLEQALKQIFTPVERKTTGGGKCCCVLGFVTAGFILTVFMKKIKYFDVKTLDSCSEYFFLGLRLLLFVGLDVRAHCE